MLEKYLVQLLLYLVTQFGVLDGVGVKADCLNIGPRPIGGLPSVGVFLRDPSPYLRKFRRKPWKTFNGYVNKRDWLLNLALPIYQFRAQKCPATGGVKDG